MAAEGDYNIMVNKNNLLAWSPKTGLKCDSGQGLHNSKSMYKVDLHICML